MASVPLFALFGKLSSKRLSDFFLRKITLLSLLFSTALMKIFIILKAKSKHFIKKALLKFTKIYAINVNL